MNRWLYAEANPATLVDPTGHCAYSQNGRPLGFLGESLGCAAGTAAGAAKALWDMGTGTVSMAACAYWAPCMRDRSQEISQVVQQVADDVGRRGLGAVAGDAVAGAGKAADQWVKDAGRPGFDGAFTISYTGTTIAAAVIGTKGLGALRRGAVAVDAAGAGAAIDMASVPLAQTASGSVNSVLDAVRSQGSWGQLSDWIRFSSKTTIPPSISGASWGDKFPAIKGGGINPKTKYTLPFHYHIHQFNWSKPWLWFQKQKT